MDIHEFKRQLVVLAHVINDGIAFFTAWQGLMVQDEISAQALNRYRGFFTPARVALLRMAIMQFAKVFDRDSRAVSLRNLLTAATNNKDHLVPFATEDDLQDIANKIDAIERLLNQLKGFRDQHLAHHDAVPANDISLAYGDVRKLVEDIKSMYNTLTLSHERATTAHEALVQEAERHTSEVVRLMCEERDRVIRMI